MRFKSTVCLLVLAGAAIGTKFATAAQTDAVSNLYPLKQGSQWHYRMEVNGEAKAISMKVGAVEKVDGVELFVLQASVDGNVVGTEHLESNKFGVFRHKTNGKSVGGAVCLVKPGIKAGDTWESVIEVDGETGTIKATVLPEVEVTVPAGKFKALPVRIETDPEAAEFATTLWFVADIGIVRQQIELPDLQITLELQKFELVR